LKYEGASLFVEVQRRAPEMIIVGGGHIALPLAQLAAICDFSVTVLDDRPTFVTHERFPTARQRISGSLRKTVGELPMDQDTYIVLVTRGHSHDVECLLEVLDRPVSYIGMIGSQRRVDAVFKLLTEEMGIRRSSTGCVCGIAMAPHTGDCRSIMAEAVNAADGGDVDFGIGRVRDQAGLMSPSPCCPASEP
jgi:xanthine/CO dehydrogenase XdhC/CoxF family maturation factor